MKPLYIILFSLLLASCGSPDTTGEFYTDWDRAGGCNSPEGGAGRNNANGDLVDVCRDSASFKWVTYAGLWCSTSKTQAPQVRAFHNSAGPDVAVYTVLTSGTDPFVGARIQDARTWAASHGFPGSHVLIEETTRVLPQHLLIGPDGYTWYRYIGYLTADEMHTIRREFASGIRYPDVL